MYFDKFPLTYYTLDDGVTVQTLPDILRRITLSKELTNNNSFFDQYDVRDGETPEIVADLFYGDSNLHWTILLANDIIDPRFDWPMEYNNVVEYSKGKYGVDNIYDTHHYQNQAEFVVESYRGLIETSTPRKPIPIIFEQSANVSYALLLQTPPVTIYSVSNLDYELAVNESKRRIRIIKPEIISEIDSTFTELINQ